MQSFVGVKTLSNLLTTIKMYLWLLHDKNKKHISVAEPSGVTEIRTILIVMFLTIFDVIQV